jgi:D-psicose/D-tagatose/L-ribulose 3-epimerase
MKFGINTFLFTSPFTDADISLFPQFKKWGFESVEIAIEDASHVNSSVIKKALDDHGLRCGSVGACMGPGRDLRGSEKEQQEAIDYLKSILDLMPELGCPMLIGPIYSSVGRAEAYTNKEYSIQWDIVIPHLRMLADYAAYSGLKIALEPLNRYETDFINTCEQGLKMIDYVGSESLMLLLDTYHMNIEEKDPADAILKAGAKLGHLHACGCDRGTPGGDHINWGKIRAALKQIHYSGDIVIESFTPDVKIIAKAASVWRQFEPSKEDIAIKGLDFLKKTLK